MIDTLEPFRYQIECSPSAATIYMGGSRCAPKHVLHLAALASRLPSGIRILRADLQALDMIDLDTIMQLRGALSTWRAERGGDVRLVLRPSLRRCAEVPRLQAHAHGALDRCVGLRGLRVLGARIRATQRRARGRAASA